MERWRILHKTSDFTVIDNGIFKDKDLTYEERGFLCSVLSLPEGWHFDIGGIVQTACEGRDRVYSIINRLIEHGYCKRTQNRASKTGRYMSYDYTFYEVKNGLGCASAPHTASPDTDSPDTDSPLPANPTVIKYYRDKVPTKSNTDKKKDISISKENFNFLSSLRSLGVSEETARGWLQVRRTKRLTNTRIAFDRIAEEIRRSGRPAEDCIRTAVENSWGGFKAEWMPPKTEEVWHGTMEEYLEECYRNGTLKR